MTFQERAIMCVIPYPEERKNSKGKASHVCGRLVVEL